MKLRLIAGGFVLGAASALISAQAISQETKPNRASQPTAQQPSPDEMQQRMMELWQEVSTPGDAHKKLEYFVGEWKTTSKIWMEGPDAPPMESDGRATVKWIMGGRFLLDEHEGTFMGMPLSGIGLTGYDNYKKKYVSTWIDNHSTAMHHMEGTMDMTGKVWSYFGTMDEWMTGEHDKTVKYLTRIVDKNRYVFEIHDLAIVPGETKVVEIAYERVGQGRG